MRRIWILTMLATTALATLMVGVAASIGATQAPGMAPLAGPYVGSYVATLSAVQAETAGDPRMAGKFTLVLKRNGTYIASNPLDPTAHGRLAVLPGRRLRFYADSGCEYGGFERPRGGVYRWSLDGRRLTFRLVSEGPCTGRTQTLTYPTWTRK